MRSARTKGPGSQGQSSAGAAPWHIPVVLTVAALLIGLSVRLLLSLPGVPDNLRTLFWNGGSLLNIFCFGLFIVGLGSGGAWMGALLRRLPLPWLLLPPLALAVSMIAYVCLFLSVTPESLHDLIGVPLVDQAARQAELKPLLDFLIPLQQVRPGVAKWLESAIRFAALYAPLPILVALFTVLISDALTLSAGTARRNLPLLICAGLLLVLCRSLVVDYAATDNLQELLAERTLVGLPGSVLIYAVIATLALNAVVLWAVLARLVNRWAGMLAVAILMAFCYWLLDASLAPAVEKYGATFRAMDFLMTGERRVPAANALRIVVGSTAQAVVLLVIALGIYTMLPARALFHRRSNA
jgi:hypothetical protein